MPPRRKLVRLSPPHRGIVEGLAYEDHDPSSTVDAQNVRGHDPATGRLRLSQRPGLKNKADANAPAAQQKHKNAGALQNISTVTLADPSPHRVGSNAVVMNSSGYPQVVDNLKNPPELVSGTTPITDEDYQFSVFDGDGNLYVVTIDKETGGGITYNKKIRKYARPYTTGTLLSSYNETSYANGRQVLGYALQADVLFIWWNGAVQGTTLGVTGKEVVTANRITDGKRVGNAGELVATTSYFLRSDEDDHFNKANGNAATVDGRVKNLMSSGGGIIGLLGGAADEAGSTLYQFDIFSGKRVGSLLVSSGSGKTVHQRLDCCVDVRGAVYAVTAYTESSEKHFRLSGFLADGSSWGVESVNSSGNNGTDTNVGNMSSVSVDDWGKETIVYVSGEGMNNATWVKHESGNNYTVGAASNNRHNLVLFDGATGQVINGGSIVEELTITQAGDAGGAGSGPVRVVTSSDHGLSDGDRVFIYNVDSGRDEANTTSLTYVKRVDATTLELFTDKSLSSQVSTTGAAVGGVSNGQLQDVTEVGVVRLYNGTNVYSGGDGGVSFGWNRARSNYAYTNSLINFVRLNTNLSLNVQKSYIDEEVKLSGSSDNMSNETLSSDQRVACHPHAVQFEDSGRGVTVREQRIVSFAGGEVQAFSKQGGFLPEDFSGSAKTASRQFSPFFSTEYSRFVDGGTLKGPYSLTCDGESYGLLEPVPYQYQYATWVATAGTLPTDDGNYARLIENWRGRIVLSGIKSDPSNWYMSAYGNPLDWDYFPSVTVETQAVAGNNSSAGKNPDIINTIVPYSDDLLLFGGDKSIWQMTGDPMSGGRLDQVSGGTGMSWGRPWAISPDGTLFFFGSRGGVYSMVPSQREPQRLGVGTLDYELTRINLSKNNIFMEWSHREEGLYVFVCPVNLHETPFSYFWDSRSGAWWKDVFPAGIQPSFVTTIDGDEPDDREILIGASNGAIYSLSETAGDDDGTEISSHAFIGPITTGTDGMIAIDEMQYILPTSGNPVSYSIHTGDTVKGAVESSAFFTGNLVAGDNAADRRRIVGKNIFLKVHNKSGEKKPWSLEGVNVFAREIGAAGARTRK